MDILPNFAVFEGGDGSGTTTQLRALQSRWAAAGKNLPPLYPTFEPTGGPVGALLRRGLRGEFPLAPLTAAYLFAADRSEHIFAPGGVRERCLRGELAVCDRYTLSSLVYQGISVGDETPLRLNLSFPLPELLLFFDIDPAIAQKRLETRAYRDIYETQSFQEKVREGYRRWLPRFACWGVRTVTIDASLPVEEVGEKVWRELQKMPIMGRG